MIHEQPWKIKDRQTHDSLEGDIQTDVAIVGGGITGISCAYHLSQLGVKNVLLEKDLVGGFSTSKSGGHLVALENLHGYTEKLGSSAAGVVMDYSLEGIDRIEELVKSHKIKCGFERNGSIEFATNEADKKVLLKEYESRRRHGLKPEFLEGEEIEERIKVNTDLYIAGLRTSQAASLNPPEFVIGLEKKLGDESKIFEGTRVSGISKRGDGVLVAADCGSVRCKMLVVATNALTPELGFLKGMVATYYTHVTATRRLSRSEIRKVGWTGRELVSDIDGAFRYIKLSSDDRVVVGKRTLLTERDKDEWSPNLQLLKRTLSEVFPDLGGTEMEYQWHGARGFTKDHMPLMGTPRFLNMNVVFSVGYTGFGLSNGFMAGKVIADYFATGKRHKIFDVYSINRKMPA